MPDIQQAKDILRRCKNELHSFQKEALNISKNKDVIAWQKVNIDSFMDVIEGLGLPDNLRHSRDAYPEIARTVLKKISPLQNSIANLEADIRLGPLSADKAIPQAKKLQQETAELHPTMAKLHLCKVGLESSSITLRQNINLATLLPLARKMATGKKKSIFETGFTIYLLTTRETGFAKEGKINMYTYFDKAALLQKKISKSASPKISKIANSMFSQQIRLCHDGLQEVKDFILFVERYIQKDMEHIHIFHEQLAEVTQQPLTDILFNIPSETEKIGACIRDFVHKKFLLEEIDRAAQLLLMIEQFYKILNDHFLNYLMKQESLPNSLLNPATLSAARANSYFSGFHGIWRMIRILLGGFTEQDAISQEILQEKLQLLLANCTDFFGHKEEDRENISDFIESYFNNYNSPFPHDELVTVAKKCLVTYGTILEKVMFRYKINQEEINSYSLGRLSGKIEVRMTNLKNYREKLNTS